MEMTLHLTNLTRRQEKSYNPYYTLVCQHLCRNSHSYKITLQFSLWDFLRDLGETTVGGAEVIKNLKDDDGGFDLKTISLTRMKNVAKAYGWWLAKDCVTLAILKVSHATQLLMFDCDPHLFPVACRFYSLETANEGVLDRYVLSYIRQQSSVYPLDQLKPERSSYYTKSRCYRRNIHKGHTDTDVGNGSCVFHVGSVQRRG